ncbi:hypothetical protein EIP86_000254 [Pleurotus ostreatoroseus]|nr:hypothetical protein EIP86_000254 [Pleurotus ostreatoroseus]
MIRYTRPLRLLHRNHAELQDASSKTTPAPANEPSSLSLQPTDLLTTYQNLVTLGKIKSDDEQIRVVMQLRRLQRDLEDYAPPALTSRYLDRAQPHDTEAHSSPPGWWLHHPADEEVVTELKALIRVKTHDEDLANLTTPKGLLLTGPPGSGKSFLVDLWFNALPTPYKARKHYNQLVLEIYRAVWEETQIRMAGVHRAPTEPEPEPEPEPPTPSPSWNRVLHNKWRELASTGLLPARWMRLPSMSLSSSPSNSQHTIAFAVAQRLVLRHWLLVFDEVQLLDVSSATLLADVLSWFWRMGGVLVGTSNKVPEDLYRNGVQRERLEPFVEALKARCPPVLLRTGRDWREVRAGDGVDSTWFTYTQEAGFLRAVEQLVSAANSGESWTNVVTKDPVPKTLSVFSRTLHIPWTLGDACRFTFSELCEESLGPADYLSLASTFRTIIITDIPVLKLSAKNQARRFISLIDALYESRCQLVCLAHSEPAALFFPDAPAPQFSPAPPASPNSASDPDRELRDDIDVMMAEAVGATHTRYRPNVASYRDAAPAPARPSPSSPSSPASTSPAPALETLAIFSGKDEQFAFQRALSRLREMTSAAYRHTERWAPLPDAVRRWERTQAEAQVSRAATESAGAEAGVVEAGSGRVMRKPEPEPDLAQEAAYASDPEESHGPASSSLRPAAPRLRSEHMWGVREDWNERARRRVKDVKGNGSSKEGP